MATQALDYIKTVNTLCEELLESHGALLRQKNIRRKQDLIQAIKVDVDKLTHALFEVRERQPLSVLRTFFGGTAVNFGEVCETLADPNIYHVGFEIHEPLDLVLYGINHWIEQSQRTQGAKMRVSDMHRFPASEAFQRRVGAYTEIMRIWLEVNERNLMLELFDIQRPADQILAAAPKPAHRNFDNLFHHDGLALEHERRIAELFADDEIWHYAFYARGPEDVTRLHAQWRKLAERNPAYHVPYAEPVHNRHDGSFHTKIVRRSQPEAERLELEFVTQYDPI